jgi:hypothetical protein
MGMDTAIPITEGAFTSVIMTDSVISNRIITGITSGITIIFIIK